jgi:hypothetical protein
MSLERLAVRERQRANADGIRGRSPRAQNELEG